MGTERILKQLEISDLLELQALLKQFNDNLSYFAEGIDRKKIYLVKDSKHFYRLKHKKLYKVYNSNFKKLILNIIFNSFYFTDVLPFFNLYFFRKYNYNIYFLDRENQEWYLVIKKNN